MNQVILQLVPLGVMFMLSFSLAVITYALATVSYLYLISYKVLLNLVTKDYLLL